MSYKSKIAVVTGGASGLGLVISRKLLEQQYKVIILDRNKELLSSLQINAEKICLELTDFKSCKSTFSQISKNHYCPEIIINNAGIIHNKSMINLLNKDDIIHDYDEFKKVIEWNLFTTFVVGSCGIEQMVKSRTKGCIINISSITATGNEGQSAYAAAKNAINSLTVTWAKELSIYGIRSNAIAPGFINTESTHNALNKNKIEEIKNKIPLRKFGTPENVALAVMNIIENDYVNGEIFRVDGGLRI